MARGDLHHCRLHLRDLGAEGFYIEQYVDSLSLTRQTLMRSYPHHLAGPF